MVPGILIKSALKLKLSQTSCGKNLQLTLFFPPIQGGCIAACARREDVCVPFSQIFDIHAFATTFLSIFIPVLLCCSLLCVCVQSQFPRVCVVSVRTLLDSQSFMKCTNSFSRNSHHYLCSKRFCCFLLFFYNPSILYKYLFLNYTNMMHWRSESKHYKEL